MDLNKIEKVKTILTQIQQCVVFDNDYQDRAVILSDSQLQEKLKVPSEVLFQQQSELLFDRWDEQEGIFDPAPVSPMYPECDKDGYSSIIFRQRPNKNGYFSYML